MNIGIGVLYNFNDMSFAYEDDTFSTNTEHRKLDEVRKSLLNPNCDGPDIVYSISMDIGKKKHRADLINRNLLYGAVIYNAGRLGKEPIRSQGHIHDISKSCGISTPEVYEIHFGKAIVYMQESAEDNPKCCYAVYADEGDIVIVPPGWAHSTISADINKPLAFGAWCVRDYGFLYKDVRLHNGLAWYPIINKNDEIKWQENTKYIHTKLIEKKPRIYSEFSIKQGKSIYKQYEENNDKFDFVKNPNIVKELWENFIP